MLNSCDKLPVFLIAQSSVSGHSRSTAMRSAGAPHLLLDLSTDTVAGKAEGVGRWEEWGKEAAGKSGCSGSGAHWILTFSFCSLPALFFF